LESYNPPPSFPPAFPDEGAIETDTYLNPVEQRDYFREVPKTVPLSMCVSLSLSRSRAASGY